MLGGIFVTYQMTVTLTDQEYQKLVTEANRRGEQPETLLHNLIQHLPSSSPETHTITGRELAEKLYREGKLTSLATRHPLPQEEWEERERFVQQLGKGSKSVSEMVIEDRGPY